MGVAARGNGSLAHSHKNFCPLCHGKFRILQIFPARRADDQ